MKNNGEVNKFKYNILKGFLSAKGFYRAHIKFKNGGKYIGGAKHCPSVYAGKCSFYENRHVVVPGTFVEYFENNKLVKYPYWQLGLFEWQKISEKVEDEG